MIGNGWRTAGMVLLGCALSACSPERPAPPPVVVAETSELWSMSEAPAPGRDPALRQIGKGEGDEALLERIKDRRETLPETSPLSKIELIMLIPFAVTGINFLCAMTIASEERW